MSSSVPSESILEDWVGAVWAKTIEVYARQGVLARCLALQDQDAVCVPSLFCMLILAAAGVCPKEQPAQNPRVQQWREHVVLNLRRARRLVKSLRGTEPHLDELSSELATLELKAERELMAMVTRHLLICSDRHKGVAPNDAFQNVVSALPELSVLGRESVEQIFDEILAAMGGSRLQAGKLPLA